MIDGYGLGSDWSYESTCIALPCRRCRGATKRIECMSTIQEPYIDRHLRCDIGLVVIREDILRILRDRHRIRCPLCITAHIAYDLHLARPRTRISEYRIGPYLIIIAEPSLDPSIWQIRSCDTLLHPWVGNQIASACLRVVEIHIHRRR